MQMMPSNWLDVVQLAEAVLLTDGTRVDKVVDQFIRDAMSRIELVEIQPRLPDAPMSIAPTMYLPQ